MDTKSKLRFDSLDGLRGICAVIIALFFHYRHFSSDTTLFRGRFLAALFNNGYLAVEIFFMLSGFVIAYNYKESVLNGNISFGSFFYKRIKHIYPIYLFTLLLAAALEVGELLLTGELFVYDGFDFFHFLLNLFCIQTGIVENSITFNGPAWCISVELLCYAIWYFITYMGKKNKTFYYVSCIVLILVGITILRQGWNYPLICDSTARGYAGFFLGALLMELNNRLTYHIKYGSSILGIILMIMLAVTNKMRVSGVYLQICFIMFFAPLIIWSIINTKMVKAFFELKPLLFLGKISLPIYLIHFPVQCGIHLLSEALGMQIPYNALLFYIFYMVCVLGNAYLLYELVIRNQKFIWEKIERYYIRQDEK